MARQEGWASSVHEALEAFLGAVGSNSAGLALVDWDCLAPAPAQAVEALKLRAPRVSVMLTAGAALTDDQVIAVLESGADDFFPHVIHTDLLLAKLKAHLRRLRPAPSRPLDVLKSPRGDIKLDRARRQLRLKGPGGRWRNQTDLTPTELELLTLFFLRPGVALERRFIVESLWRGAQDEIRPGTVDKHVESLRRKMGRLGSRIKTIYGVGYAYRD